MKILLSNDDGVHAEGLDVLAKALGKCADVVVIAPDRNRTGASNSLTLKNPIRITRLPNGYTSVEGTPTDCVHLGLTGLLDFIPDLVVAGINEGSNLGDDILYSGTVAAATEGRFLGFPGIAISLVGNNCKHYETAANVAVHLVNSFKNHTFPPSTVLNVNVPDIPFEQLRGYEITRLGTRHSAEPTIKEVDPRGHTIYWVGPPGTEQDAGPGTDFYAINDKKVSITPIQLDLTNYRVFEQLSGWVSKLGDKLTAK